MSSAPRRTTVPLSLRVSPEAQRAARDRARRAGMTMSAFVSALLLSGTEVAGRPAADATREALALHHIRTRIEYYRAQLHDEARRVTAHYFIRELNLLRDEVVRALRALEPTYDEQLDARHANEDWQIAEPRAER